MHKLIHFILENHGTLFLNFSFSFCISACIYILAVKFLKRDALIAHKTKGSYISFWKNQLSTSLAVLAFINIFLMLLFLDDVIDKEYLTVSAVWLSMLSASAGWMIHIKNNHILNRKKQTLDVLIPIRDKHKNDLMKIYSLYPPTKNMTAREAVEHQKEFHDKNNYKLNEDKQPIFFQLARMFNTYETIASFLYQGVLDKQIVEEVCKDGLVSFYFQFQEFINIRTQNGRDKYVYNNLTKLMNEDWKEHIEKIRSNHREQIFKDIISERAKAGDVSPDQGE